MNLLPHIFRRKRAKSMRTTSLSWGLLLIGFITLLGAYQHHTQPTLIASATSNPNLKYFGYYHLIQPNTPVYGNLLPKLLPLHNSNIVHGQLRFDSGAPDVHNPASLGVSDIRQFIQQAKDNNMKVILELDYWTMNYTPGSPEWNTTIDAYKRAVQGYEDTVYAFYYDEPLPSNNANYPAFRDAFVAMTGQLHQLFPMIGNMVIEMAPAIDTRTSDLYQNVTDLGFDYYYVGGPSNADYLRLFHLLESKATSNQKMWLIPETWGQATGSAFADVHKLYYNFALTDPRITGILAFPFPRIDGSCSTIDFITPGNACYSDVFVRVDQQIGHNIMYGFQSQVTPTCRIQGYILDQNGNAITNQGFQLVFDADQVAVGQPYSYPIWAGGHKVTLLAPPGYQVLYSQVVGGVGHLASSFVPGDTAVIDCPDNSFNDLWWKIVPVAPSPTPTPVLMHTLSGTVYTDANGNGVKDSSEAGMPNVQVTVSGMTSAVTTSDAQGNYRFTNLPQATTPYSIVSAIPVSYRSTTQNPTVIPLTQDSLVSFGMVIVPNALPVSRPNPTITLSVTPNPLPPTRTILTPTPTTILPTPTVKPTNTPTPTPTNSPQIRLGGMDLDGYCQNNGQKGAVLLNNVWTCTPNNISINLNAACQWQYKDPTANAKQERTNDPYSYACFGKNLLPPTLTPTPQPVRLGNMDLDGFCKSTGQIGAALVNNQWNCVPANTQINLNTACQSQYKIPTAIAKQERPNDPFSFACYKN